ncbi:MAG: ribosome silencing factor [Actinomycetota bacterium]
MPATSEAIELAVAAAAAADDKKALDPLILEVADVLAVVDLFLIVSASNERQLAAIVDAIEERLAGMGRRVLRREGTPESGWVLLDLGDLVCHVMTVAERAHYELERLWGDVATRDVLTGAPAPPLGRRAAVPAGAEVAAADGPDTGA